MLTIDLGNSRLKARLWRLRSGAPECVARLDLSSGDVAGLGAWLQERRPTVAALSSVASAETTRLVRECLERGVERLSVSPVPALENRTLSPELVGQDRLYAAAGAAAELGSSCLVVDAGTCLTVDALLVSGGTRAFLGGAIAPGPELLAESLATGTARLPRIEPRPGGRALGRNTEEALQAGVALGLRGAAAGLVEEVAREAELLQAPVVLTGGARRFLLEPRPFTARSLRESPELVHRGLLESALRADPVLGTVER